MALAGPSRLGWQMGCPACSPRTLLRSALPARPLGTPACRYASSSSEAPLPRAAPVITNVSQLSNKTRRRLLDESQSRFYAARAKKSRSLMLYSVSAIILSIGVTYAAVPLYRAFCSATGFAGTPLTDKTRFTPDRLYTTPESEKRKRITVHFEATTSDTLPWKFKPQQRSVRVLPGETALAFYRAKNFGKEDLIGIATYNMQPDKIAPYFAKVECFCFDEQKIRAGEEVDLPVFFFIDRDIMEDPALDGLDDVVLSYTFFRAKRNDKGHAVPDAPEDVIERSQGFEKYQLARRNGTSPA